MKIPILALIVGEKMDIIGLKKQMIKEILVLQVKVLIWYRYLKLCLL